MTDKDEKYNAFLYDPLYQLKAETKWSQKTGGSREYQYAYVFDPNGNRIVEHHDGVMKSFDYGDNNEMLSAGGVDFTYDHFGNTKTKVDGSGTTTYNYDFENHLLNIDFPNTANDDDHEYDGVGRRMRSKLNGASDWTNFVFDELTDNLICEYTLISGTFTIKSLNTWGIGLISTNREGTKRYFHFDGLGSTVALTDFDMNVTDTYVYSAFGITESSSGSSVNPFRFVGQWGYYDDGARGGQSGLLLLGVRYYSPEFGRFFDLNADFYNESFNLLAKLEFTPSYLFLTNSPSITIVESRMTQFKASYIVAPTEVPFYPSYECSIREKDCAQWYKENWKIVYYFCVAACIGIKCGRRPTLGCINSCKKECEKATKAGSPPNYAHCGKIDDPDKCQECCLKVCGGRWKCSQDCALACCD